MRKFPYVRAMIALFFLCGALTSASMAQAGTLVTYNLTVGSAQRSIQFDLFDDVAPQTVTNFLNYVTSGRYQDTIVHRYAVTQSGSPFVIQGGGYNVSQFTSNPLPNLPAHIPVFASPQNEYQLSNARIGTLAMARVGQQVNSATSEWFVNMTNNTFLNTVDQGFTVFGWVVGDGMNVLNEITTFNRTNINFPGGTFGDVPKNGQGQFVTLNSVSVVETHPSFQNPLWDADVNNSGTLTAADIMPIVNGLLTQNGRFTPAKSNVGDTYKYWDTNGDNSVSVSDLMRVVNAILRGDTAPAAPLAAPMADALVAVPEPSTLALVTMAIVATLTVAIRRRRSRSAA